MGWSTDFPLKVRIIPETEETPLSSTHLAFLVKVRRVKQEEERRLSKKPAAWERRFRNAGGVHWRKRAIFNSGVLILLFWRRCGLVL
jgi:hypothetical protein